MENPKQITDLLSQLNSEKFIQDLVIQGAEIFLVGGIVRDGFLGIKSKDVDLLIRNLDIEKIMSSISKFGKLTETTVADKMGIIKFQPKNSNLDSKFLEEDIDIALPRTETLMTQSEIKLNGITNIHNAFNVNSDPSLSVEVDLERRDFTINSIAIRLDGTVFDPFNGLKDIQKHVIRHTNSEAFSDDPLRMFRAIQFASRFDGFFIARDTMNLILENSEKSKDIASERIHTELLKIFNKGNISKGIKILRDSSLLSNFVDFRPSAAVETINTVGDFFFHICRNGENFRKILNGDNQTRKAIDAIHFANSVMHKKPMTRDGWDMGKIRLALFDAIQISESVLDSGKLLGPLGIAQEEFNQGLFPKNMKELKISGKDLIEIGLSPGPEIGDQLRESVRIVLTGNVPNTKKELVGIAKFLHEA